MRYYTFRQPQKKNRVTQEFGERPEFYKRFGFRGHEGLDINDSPGVSTPVYAVEDGIVVTRQDGAYGNRCDIYSERIGIMVSYCHLSRFEVKTKDKVRAGDLIGYTGNTSTYDMPIHLHIMVKEINDNLEIVNRNNGYDGSLECGIEEGLFWYEHPRQEYWKLPVRIMKSQPKRPINALYSNSRIRLYPHFFTNSLKVQKSILEHERAHHIYFAHMSEKERKEWINISRFTKEYQNLGYKENQYITNYAKSNSAEDFAENWERICLVGDVVYNNYLDYKMKRVKEFMYKYQ